MSSHCGSQPVTVSGLRFGHVHKKTAEMSHEKQVLNLIVGTQERA